MGNLCSSSSQEIEYLESKLDDQTEKIEQLLFKVKLLERENKYLKTKHTNFTNQEYYHQYYD